jgi:hypothetical protein
MKSYPGPEEVLDDLGDKVVEAFSRAVARASADFEAYRESWPAWVAQASERGLASWIHDRMWYHLTVLVIDISEVRVIDQEPIRELIASYRYRLRAKRHGEDGRVSTYPTQTAIEFLWQQDFIDGLEEEFKEELNLIVGYVWDPELREIGRSVLSLRNRSGVEWMHDLPITGTGLAYATPQPILPTLSGPATPRIETPEVAMEEDGTEGGDQ